MSTKSDASQEMIKETNKAAFLQYFKDGCKPEGTPQRYGLEVEHFIVEKASERAGQRTVPYSGTHGVEAILRELSRYYEKEMISEGHLIGLDRAECTITLEPGAQVEVSIKAYSEPEEIMRVYQQFRDEIDTVLAKYHYELFCGGESPVTKAEEVELLPKTRYRYMDRYFHEIGPYGTKMMRGTAATQLSIDYYSEEDFSRKYSFLYQYVPFLAGLFNADHGQAQNGQYGRLNIWNRVDPARVDITPFMQNGRITFEGYLAFIMQMPVIVKPIETESGTEYEYCTKTVGELMQEEVFTREQIEHYLSMAFPIVRVKNFIEIRFADSMPTERIYAFLRFMKSMIERQSAPSMRELVELDIPGHQKSGREALKRFAASSATYRGNVITTRYMPKLFDVKTTERIRDAAETMASIMGKTIEEYLRNPAYRKKFGFTEQQEQMICNRPDYVNLLPVARVDIFLNEETGDFQFCELNTDGTSAMNEDLQLSLVFEKTKLYDELCEEYAVTGLRPVHFELFDSLTSAFLENYETDPNHVEHPHVAVVDFLELGCSTTEFQMFADSFCRQGATAEVCEIRDLTYDGEGLFSKNGHKIDLIYRRAVTSDILAHEAEVQPFLQAIADRKVCMMGNFCTQVVHDKSFFAIMQEADTMTFLTQKERDFIRAHVPYTADLTKEAAREKQIKSTRVNWILKPKDSYGSHGIFAGVNMDQKAWEQAVDRCSEEGSNYIFQQFVTPYKTRNIDFRKENPSMQPHSNLTGLYVYNQKFAGVYSRQATGEIISSEYDEIALPTFYLTE